MTQRPQAAPQSRRALLAATGTAALILTGLVGCSASKPDPVPADTGVEPTVTVRVVDNAFEPAQVSIKPGQAVRWMFEGPDRHDVVAGDGSFVSELMSSGEYTHVFDAAGEFLYDCSIHPEMTGVVTVTQ